MEQYVGWIIVALAWVGQLVWQIARQSVINKQRDKEILDLEESLGKNKKALDDDMRELSEDIAKLREWGESKISERIIYNEKHYLSIERFNECNDTIMRMISEINNLNLAARLTKMETQLDYIVIEIKKLTK